MSRNRDSNQRDSEPGSRRKDGRKSANNSPLFQTAIFGALGFQFVGVVVGTYFVGASLDEKYGTSPWAVVLLMAAGLLGTAYHTYRITKRFVTSEEEESGD